MTAEYEDDDVATLATELARVRQRGIDYLDRFNRRQRRVSTPRLDQLAILDKDGQRSRPAQLAAFLDGQLELYRQRFPAEAQFIQQLLFDDAGRTPGPTGPAGLLKRARSGRYLSDETFRKYQRQRFLEFADFLLTPDPPPRWRDRLVRLLPVGRSHTR